MARRTRSERGFERARTRMVDRDLRMRGIVDDRVLEAMSRVPRHAFVPPALTQAAYSDGPLPIGDGQTISQPYIVALMTEALHLVGEERVLELGTGSGYQTAVLAEIGAQIWTVERLAQHTREAQARLSELGYTAIRFRTGDGTIGWQEEAPFDRILATGSLPAVPHRLLAQLAEGGLFVGPIGPIHSQSLLRIEYHGTGTRTEDLGGCRFVPLIGEAGWKTAPPLG